MDRWTQRVFPPFVAGRGALGLLLLRLVIGCAFTQHGWGKIQHPFSWMGPDAGTPRIFQGLAALSEFGGGLAWMLGLLTPLASLGVFFTMAVAVWTHASSGGAFIGGQGSYELPLAYLLVALVLILVGPGVLSLDALIFNRRRA